MRQIRTSGQPYQTPWREWDGDATIPDEILLHMEDAYWVYDCDTCGDATIQFVVREHDAETYWQVDHAWWIEYEPEWCVRNEFDVQQIDAVTFAYPRMNRDWMKLTHR
jgi:hypothetical protein